MTAADGGNCAGLCRITSSIIGSLLALILIIYQRLML